MLSVFAFFFFNDTATTEIYTLSLHDALPISERFPQFRGWGEAPLRPLAVEAITASSAGTVFLATPHEVSAELAPKLLQAGLRVIDLSGAFRFRGAETFTSWYQLPAPHAEWLGEAVYGLPELYSKEIAAARLVANPGCYSTSVILALRSEEHTSELQSQSNLVCRLLLEKKKNISPHTTRTGRSTSWSTTTAFPRP